jgi:hypothetical protein
MTPIQEMVVTLFSDDVIEQAKRQAKSKIEIVYLEKFDIIFRLLKINDKNINLEIKLSRPFGPSRKSELGSIKNMISYFKPIGVYNIEHGFFSTKVSIILLYEFEKHYSALAGNKIPVAKYQVEKLTMRENAVIAAFSMDAVAEALEMKDKNLFINGLNVEFIMAFDGYPQMFLDDGYNINGPIAAYFVEGPNSLNPIVDYKEIFDDLDSRKLLSAYNQI